MNDKISVQLNPDVVQKSLKQKNHPKGAKQFLFPETSFFSFF